jgi:hypothetical protein
MILSLLLLGNLGSAEATSYQDWWNNPLLKGVGLSVGQQGRQLFVGWYMYDADTSPSFLVFYGTLDGNNTLTAPLRRFTGSPMPLYDSSLWSGEVIGTATIAFSSATAGTFSYQIDGQGESQAGSFTIQRYTFNPIDLSGVYEGASRYTATSCGGNDGSHDQPESFTITQDGNNLRLETSNEGCTYEGVIQQQGTHFTGSGNFYCNSGSTGTWSSPDIQALDIAMTLSYTAASDGGCRIDGRAGGVRLAD